MVVRKKGFSTQTCQHLLVWNHVSMLLTGNNYSLDLPRKWLLARIVASTRSNDTFWFTSNVYGCSGFQCRYQLCWVTTIADAIPSMGRHKHVETNLTSRCDVLAERQQGTGTWRSSTADSLIRYIIVDLQEDSVFYFLSFSIEGYIINYDLTLLAYNWRMC